MYELEPEPQDMEDKDEEKEENAGDDEKPREEV